jgi:nucleotide-binding universal stress UspA family protein
MAGQVIILSVVEEARADERSCERLRHALSWQNPNTSVRCLKHADRPAVDTLLAAAADANADLLVMGGYGHSRLREVIFGGFTRHVLSHAELPVLMTH